MRKEMHSKSPFVEERERYYYYQSPEVRSSTPSWDLIIKLKWESASSFSSYFRAYLY